MEFCLCGIVEFAGNSLMGYIHECTGTSRHPAAANSAWRSKAGRAALDQPEGGPHRGYATKSETNA